MADYSISITVPDGKNTELIAALRWHYGPKSTDPTVEFTPAELRTKLKASVEQSLKDIFTRHKVALRNAQAVDDAIAIT